MNQSAGEKAAAKESASPDFAEHFEVRLFGLPLNRNDNLTCLLPVMLAVLAQIRFNTSFMAEGGFAFAAVIGYIAMRLWLVNRRFPNPGQIELLADRLIIPASLSGKDEAETFYLKDITRIIVHVYRGRHSSKMTSMLIYRGLRVVNISGLAIELEAFTRALEEKGRRCERQAWFPMAVVAALILIGLLFVAFVLWQNFS